MVRFSESTLSNMSLFVSDDSNNIAFYFSTDTLLKVLLTIALAVERQFESCSELIPERRLTLKNEKQ